MRRERLYLADILEAIDHIANFIANADFDEFCRSELLRSAVVQKLAVIGEAAGRIPTDIRERYPEVPWPQLVAFRNVLIHSYFGIDWEIVWHSAKERCPQLRSQIARILDDLRDADDGNAG